MRAADRSAGDGGERRSTSIPQRIRRTRSGGMPSSRSRCRYASEKGTITLKLEKLACRNRSYRRDVRTEFPQLLADLLDDPRKARRAARVVVRSRQVAVFQIEVLVGSEIYRNRFDPTDREVARGQRVEHEGQDLDLVSLADQAADHVEPEVLVPSVAERQDPGPNDHDPQVSVVTRRLDGGGLRIVLREERHSTPSSAPVVPEVVGDRAGDEPMTLRIDQC